MKYQHFILPILAFIVFASLSSADQATDKKTAAEHLDAAGKSQTFADQMVAQGDHYSAAYYYSEAATSFEAGGEHEKAVAMSKAGVHSETRMHQHY